MAGSASVLRNLNPPCLSIPEGTECGERAISQKAEDTVSRGVVSWPELGKREEMKATSSQYFAGTFDRDSLSDTQSTPTPFQELGPCYRCHLQAGSTASYNTTPKGTVMSAGRRCKQGANGDGGCTDESAFQLGVPLSTVPFSTLLSDRPSGRLTCMDDIHGLPHVLGFWLYI